MTGAGSVQTIVSYKLGVTPTTSFRWTWVKYSLGMCLVGIYIRPIHSLTFYQPFFLATQTLLCHSSLKVHLPMNISLWSKKSSQAREKLSQLAISLKIMLKHLSI